ncbi:hypothetical protein F4775DRAFT_589528 [Biscogniauxia sp. FL1348]|nr:hypothetical protein F4775DRAFT_589528 [Biscogniauxia sp. FL1348]
MRILGAFSFILLSGVTAIATQDKICPLSPFQRSKESVCADPAVPHDFDASTPFPTTHDKTQESTGDPSAWSGPENCINETCIFANNEIGGGMVLLTNRYYAEKIKGFPRVSEPDSATPPPFYPEEVPGKGIGLVANRTIRKGEIIMVRSPTLVAHAGLIVRMEEGAREAFYDSAMGKLSTARREEFMNQMGEGVHGKIETNCFQLYIDGGKKGSSHLGCYPEISRFNHDCRPNVHYRLSNLTHTTVAVRDIAPGEELSISYIDLLLSHADRTKRLSKWGFQCSCAQCTADANSTAASDARLRRIAQLNADLETFGRTAVTADTGAELVALYRAERLDSYLGRAYTRAALNFALFGDEARAREYAAAAADAVAREVGPGAADAEAMRLLAENPGAHWTWGKRRKGRS